MKTSKWIVVETACWPKSFKIYNDLYVDDNDSSNYFLTRIEAQLECDKRNKKDESKNQR